MQLSSIVSHLKAQAAETLNDLGHFSTLWNQVCVCLCVCVLVLLSCTNSWLCLGPRGAGAGLPAVRPLPDGVQRSDLLLLCESTSCYRRTTEHRRAFTAYYVFS